MTTLKLRRQNLCSAEYSTQTQRDLFLRRSASSISQDQQAQPSPLSSSEQQPKQQPKQQPNSEDESVTLVIVPNKFIPYPFSYRQEVDIQIETLTNRGLGLGRFALSPEQIRNMEEFNVHREKTKANLDETLDHSTLSGKTNKQWVIMVPGVVPGERVCVRVFRNFPSYSEADLVRVLEASEDRVSPVCPLAQDCGGCQLQHMTIDSQRKWKTRHVKEILQQYGIGEEHVKYCLGTDHIYHYRSKLTPHYQQPAKSRRGERNIDMVASSSSSSSTKTIQAIGFQKQSSRQIIDVPHCAIATPAVNDAYAEMRKRLLSEPPKSKKGATLLLRQANLEDSSVESNHRNFITTNVRGLNFTYHAGNFFQNNYHVLPIMVEHVLSEATLGGAMTHLVDCYCGSGMFALSCAAHFDRVVGIEINDKAIAEAQANAAANRISNCEFRAASAENIFSVISNFSRDATVVVLDPPRKGCSEDFLKQLVEFEPSRIVYMSCDPTTQARDAAILVAANYTVTSVQPFDLFPQTRHIECLMILERK